MKKGGNMRTNKHIRLEFSPPGVYTFGVPIWKKPAQPDPPPPAMEVRGNSAKGQSWPAQGSCRRVEIRLDQFSLSRLAGFCPQHQWVTTDSRPRLYATVELSEI
jgi:hypothetical protein